MARIRFEGFPMDGRFWWLRWFDHPYWDRSTETHHVELALSLLPASTRPDCLPPLDARLAAVRASRCVVRAHIGLVPVFSIGMVFRNGDPIGLLEPQKASFRFVRGECTVELLPIREVSDPLPLFPSNEDRTEFAIGRQAYRLEGFDDSFCVRIRPAPGKGPELVLPCCETFRTWYAPHRAIALALADGPWASAQSQVVRKEPDRPTRVEVDGSWHVSLAGRVGEDHLAVLGNLVLNLEGRKAANQVWQALRTPSPYMQRQHAAGRRPAAFLPGRLRAPIPFAWDVLELDVLGFKPSTDVDAWVGLRIFDFAWPPPPMGPPLVIHWLPWRDTRRGEKQDVTNKPPPFGGTIETIGADGDKPAVDPDVDPSKGSEETYVRIVGATQRNPPRLERAEKALSHIYTGERRTHRRTEVGAISAGNAVPGPTGAATAQASTSEGKPASSRFAEVLAMFEGLLAGGSIEGYKVVHPGPQDTEQRGALAAWRFPAPPLVRGRRSHWFMLDSDTNRAALVCALQLDAGYAYWVEIEMTADESGYRSLLFTAEAEALASAIHALLHIAMEMNGVWPDGDELVKKAGVHAALRWKHSHVGERLNAGRALAAIRVLVPAPLAAEEPACKPVGVAACEPPEIFVEVG